MCHCVQANNRMDTQLFQNSDTSLTDEGRQEVGLEQTWRWMDDRASFVIP